MTMLRNAALGVASFAAVYATTATPAHAEYEPRQCRAIADNEDNLKGKELEESFQQLDECQRDFMAIIPINERAAAGQVSVRVFVQPGERSLLLVIEYLRSKDARHYWVDMRALVEPRPRLIATVSRSSYAAMERYWAQELSDMSKPGDFSIKMESGIESVCIDRGFATVETAIRGQSQSVDLNRCRPDYAPFIEKVYAQTMHDLPVCSKYKGQDDYEKLIHCLSQAGIPQ